MSKSAAAGALIKSRIVGHGEEAPDSLLANPFNYRRHPGAQMDVLRGSLGELGWVKGVIVNKRTQHVLDGHARVQLAMEQGLPSIPVDYVDLSAEEEKLALTLLDPSAEMAIHDDDALRALLDDISTDDPALLAMLDELPGKARPKAGGVAVEEVDFSQVSDRFWVNIRGPLPAQIHVLEKLRAAMEEIPGVEVEIGTMGGEETQR